MGFTRARRNANHRSGRRYGLGENVPKRLGPLNQNGVIILMAYRGGLDEPDTCAEKVAHPWPRSVSENVHDLGRGMRCVSLPFTSLKLVHLYAAIELPPL
jgi:hypothetical protein